MVRGGEHKIYAMILQNKVIGVLPNQKTEPWWPPDPVGNPVTAVPCDDTVTIGMIYDPETGEFSEYIPLESEPEPALSLPLSEQEQVAIDTALNVEYIACLMEANL